MQLPRTLRFALLMGLTALSLAACKNPSLQKIKAPSPAKDIKHEAITITGGGGDLIGEITVPADLKPGERRPGIILVGRSGPTDLDETVPAAFTSDQKEAKPFVQLADSLTRAGFIVLRYSKRGVEKTVTDFDAFNKDPNQFVNLKSYQTINRLELLIDAKHAMAYLRSDARVAGVSVVGHGEGAMLATVMANADTAVRSIILLGVPTRNLKDVLYYQEVESMPARLLKSYDKNNDGALSTAEAPAMAASDKDGNGVLSSSELKAALETSYQAMLTTIENGDDKELINELPRGWYRSWFKAESTADSLRRLRPIPMYIAQGEDEIQGPSAEMTSLVAELKKAGKTVTFMSYPGLGHGFSATRDGHYTFGPFDQAAIDDVSKWARQVLFL